MSNITTRSSKGSALTHAEMDANWTRTVDQKTTTYQILAADNRSAIEGNSATPFTVTLPTVANAAGEDTGDFEVHIWNINTGVVSVDGSGSETINGSTNAITLGQWESVTVKLDSADGGWVTTSRVGDLGAVNGTFTGNLTGDVTGDVTGNVTGNLTGDVTGNSDTVTTNADLVGHVTSVGNTSTLAVASITGQADIGGAITDTDELIINDGGAIRRTDMSRVTTYIVEEGSWTPTIQDTTLSDGESQTYTIQTGQYTKIGNTVFITGTMTVNSTGSLSLGDAAFIGGLPFTASSTANVNGSISVGWGDSFSVGTAGFSVSGYIAPGADEITLTLWDAVAGMTALSISQYSAGGEIIFNGQYRV